MAKYWDRSAAAKKGWQTRRAKAQYQEWLEEEWTKGKIPDWYINKEEYPEYVSPLDIFEYDETEEIETPEEYDTENEEYMDIGEAIDNAINDALDSAVSFINMARVTRTELESIKTEIGIKQYYKNLSDNWLEINLHVTNILADYNNEKVFNSEVAIVGFAANDNYRTTSFMAELVLARRIDAREEYRRRHPNAKHRV